MRYIIYFTGLISVFAASAVAIRPMAVPDAPAFYGKGVINARHCDTCTVSSPPDLAQRSLHRPFKPFTTSPSHALLALAAMAVKYYHCALLFGRRA